MKVDILAENERSFDKFVAAVARRGFAKTGLETLSPPLKLLLVKDPDLLTPGAPVYNLPCFGSSVDHEEFLLTIQQRNCTLLQIEMPRSSVGKFMAMFGL